jgi:hypothetical protein
MGFCPTRMGRGDNHGDEHGDEHGQSQQQVLVFCKCGRFGSPADHRRQGY